MQRYILFVLVILLFFPSAYAVTCNVNVGVELRPIVDNVWGIHDDTIMGGQRKVNSDCSAETQYEDRLDAWRNTSWDRDRAAEAWVQITRSDIDLDNKCLTYTGSNMCVFGTSATSEYQNINTSANATKWISDRGGTQIWTLDSPPRRFADNATFCKGGGYGDTSNFDFTACGWSNLTKAGEITAQFAQTVGCNGTYSCKFAPENEPYGVNFLYGLNGSEEGMCAARVSYVGAMWPAWAAKLKADCPTCRTISPSFTLDSIYGGGVGCAERVARAFMGNVTENSTNAPECIDFHSMYYSSLTDPKELYNRGEDAWLLAKQYSWEDHICGTEGAAHADDNTYQVQPARGIATHTYAFNKAIAELGYDFYTPFLWGIASSKVDSYSDTTGCSGTSGETAGGTGEWYRMVENRNSTPYTTWFYDAQNRSKWVMSGTSFVNATSDDSNVSCIASMNGTDQLYVHVSALRAATTPVTINVLGAEINNTYIVTNATSVSPSDNDTVVLPTCAGWCSQVVQFNLTAGEEGGGGGINVTRFPIFLNGGVVLKDGLVVLK